MSMVILAFGALMGSFLNLVAMRSLRGKSIVSPRSHCEYCERVLDASSLIPILSYLVQRGRCKYCDHPLELRYLLSELVLPILYLWIFLRLGLSWAFFEGLVIGSILYVLALTDLEEESLLEVHLACLYGLAILGILLRFYQRKLPMGFFLLPMLFLLLQFFVERYLPGRIGDGDLMLLIPLFSYFDPLKGLAFLFIAIWLALIPSIICLLKGGSLKTKIPMAPFITLSFFLVYLEGDMVLRAWGWIG